MSIRSLWVSLAVFAVAVGASAADLHSAIFVQTPSPAAGEIATPRVLAADPQTNRCYVLDTGLQRVLAMTPNGQQVAEWPFSTLHIDDMVPVPADPMLPQPAIAIGKDTVYLLSLDRAARKVSLLAMDGPAEGRSVQLPDGAGGGACAMDATGRVLVAYLQVTAGKTTFNLAREGNNGSMETVATLNDPCDGQTMFLNITGFTVSADGQIAVGIAQNGNPGYSFIRSWLIQGALQGATVGKDLQTTHRFSLLDPRGKPQDRFRNQVDLAGQNGYPAKPCVPLFTALAFGPNGMIVSGGHSVDPFLRVYSADGNLLRSIQRRAVGGQNLAVLPGKDRLRLFATNPALSRVEEIAPDGRVFGGFGRPYAYTLAQPVSLTARPDTLYVATKRNGGYDLLRFANDGTFLWTQRLIPPKGMEQPQPLLCALASDRVLIGWRQPNTLGVGWVDTVLDDGMPGAPLWNEPINKPGTQPNLVGPTVFTIGDDGRVYVLRETKDGTRLQAFSATGAFLQQYPMGIQGVSMVTNTDIAWAHCDDQGEMTIARYARVGGGEQGWKRIPRPAQPDASLLPARAKSMWGWLSSTHSLLRFDDTFTVVDESPVVDTDDKAVTTVSAVAGDGAGHLYLAIPDRILLVQEP